MVPGNGKNKQVSMKQLVSNQVLKYQRWQKRKLVTNIKWFVYNLWKKILNIPSIENCVDNLITYSVLWDIDTAFNSAVIVKLFSSEYIYNYPQEDTKIASSSMETA